MNIGPSKHAISPLTTVELQASFFDAAKQGNLQRLKKILDLGLNIDIEDNDGKTALYYAVKNSHRDAVKLQI